jgi:hypothetical protein
LIQFDVKPSYSEPPVVDASIPFDANMLEAEPLVAITIPELLKKLIS